MRKTLLVLTVLAMTAGGAHAADLELTPFIAYRFGGEVPAESNDLFEVDAKIDEDAAFGIAMDIKVAHGLLIGLFASRQETNFVDDSGLFLPEEDLLGVEITYYQIGVGWSRRIADYEPFVLGSLGITNIKPDAFGLHDEDEFSLSFGGGVKIWFNNHVGARFEARGFWTDLGSAESEWEFWDEYQHDLYQGEVNVGLVLAF
jgi:opacity protein-like surface antigen